MIKIDEAICTRCNTCSQHCVAGIIAEGPEIKEEIHKYCILCGHCAVVCPSGAISVVGFDDLEIPSYTKAPLISSEAMETLLRRRRSIRHYKNEPVSRDHLEKMIEASSLVPTGGNRRAFKAYVCSDREVISQLHRKTTRYFTRYAEVLSTYSHKYGNV
jgi:ferredoxin